jgi:hypothetical protein
MFALFISDHAPVHLPGAAFVLSRGAIAGAAVIAANITRRNKIIAPVASDDIAPVMPFKHSSPNRFLTTPRNHPMTLSMYQTSVPVTVRALEILAHVLKKGAEHAAKKNVTDEVLLQTRLIPDMLPLVKQVQIACDMATRGASTPGRVEPMSFEDNETTLEQTSSRIHRAIEYIKTFKSEQIDGSESRTIILKTRTGEMTFEGQATCCTSSFQTCFSIARRLTTSCARRVPSSASRTSSAKPDIRHDDGSVPSSVPFRTLPNATLPCRAARASAEHQARHRSCRSGIADIVHPL